MARHPQARELAELKGATRKHPERYRKQPPKVEQPLGNAPVHLTDAAKAVWFEIETYAPTGILKGADRIALEMLANLLAEYRNAPTEFAVGKYTHLIGCLARLGMTPADRQKLGVEKPDEEGNEFAEF
jgi:phage terminase small subunit